MRFSPPGCFPPQRIPSTQSHRRCLYSQCHTSTRLLPRLPRLAADAIPFPFPPPIQPDPANAPRQVTNARKAFPFASSRPLFSSPSRQPSGETIEETTTSCLVKNRGGEPKGAAFFSRASSATAGRLKQGSERRAAEQERNAVVQLPSVSRRRLRRRRRRSEVSPFPTARPPRRRHRDGSSGAEV